MAATPGIAASRAAASGLAGTPAPDEEKPERSPWARASGSKITVPVLAGRPWTMLSLIVDRLHRAAEPRPDRAEDAVVDLQMTDRARRAGVGLDEDPARREKAAVDGPRQRRRARGSGARVDRAASDAHGVERAAQHDVAAGHRQSVENELGPRAAREHPGRRSGRRAQHRADGGARADEQRVDRTGGGAERVVAQ